MFKLEYYRKHTLTAFGKVIYDITQITIENAVSNYWKLKGIDSLEMLYISLTP